MLLTTTIAYTTLAHATDFVVLSPISVPLAPIEADSSILDTFLSAETIAIVATCERVSVRLWKSVGSFAIAIQSTLLLNTSARNMKVARIRFHVIF